MDRALSRAPRPAIVLLAAVGIPVVLVVAVLALGWSLQPGRLDPADVERDVAAQYETRAGVALELSCPEDMPRESGGVFLCRGTTGDGERLVVEVEIADPSDDAEYHWVDHPA